MLYGLDLFSGIGGNTLALAPWVKTIAYCEKDPYATGVLLSRMAKGEIPPAPIWDDVSTLKGAYLPPIDIIIGGFPCQDISVAGRGAGLEGKRSGLFFEIVRLAEEIKPSYLFLENVPGIRTRGLDCVVRTLSDAGYDLRWCSLSAQAVGALHKRDRWFLLAAHADRCSLRYGTERMSGRWPGTICPEGKAKPRDNGAQESLAHSQRNGLEGAEHTISRERAPSLRRRFTDETSSPEPSLSEDWESEPNVDRVVDGLSHRVDRIRCLGNAVVPAQAREAFRYLIGAK